MNTQTIVLNGFGPGVKFKVSKPKTDTHGTLLVVGGKGVKAVDVTHDVKVRFAA